jgi:hypothetical protein
VPIASIASYRQVHEDQRHLGPVPEDLEDGECDDLDRDTGAPCGTGDELPQA